MPSKVKTNNLSNYNPALDKYSNVDLFPEKTKKANEALSKPGVKEWLKDIETEKKLNSEKNTKP
jgi:hypothetical protein